MMDTALPQKFPFILDRNLPKVNCRGNRDCTSCDIVVLGWVLMFKSFNPGPVYFLAVFDTITYKIEARVIIKLYMYFTST